MKTSYLISILRYMSFPNCLYLFFIHTCSFWANDKTQEHIRFMIKRTLFKIDIQFILSQNIKNISVLSKFYFVIQPGQLLEQLWFS